MKRKIKFLFIAISICAMLFAFAISSSAWSVHPQEYDEYAYLCTDNGETVAYVWYKSGNELCVSVDFSKDLKNIRSYTLTNNFGHMNDYSDEQIFIFIEEYIASVKASMTEGMYSQSQLDSAVAKALDEANLSMTEIACYPTLNLTSTPSFNLYQKDENIDNSFTMLHDGMEGTIILNVQEFQGFCNAHQIVDLESFNSKVKELHDSLGHVDSMDPCCWYYFFTSGMFSFTEASFNFFYNYDLLTEEEYNTSIQQSKAEGVEEYKSSDEYTTALNNKYSAGYTEGIESFKSSNAYTDALDLQYSNGKTAGVTEYKASTEYANALEAEYNEGYDNGVADTEGENTKNTTTRLVSILIGVLGFGILFLGVLSAVGTFKKKRKHR